MNEYKIVGKYPDGRKEDRVLNDFYGAVEDTAIHTFRRCNPKGDLDIHLYKNGERVDVRNRYGRSATVYAKERAVHRRGYIAKMASFVRDIKPKHPMLNEIATFLEDQKAWEQRFNSMYDIDYDK